MKKRKINKAARKALELLEDRRLMSAITFSGGNLQLQGDSNQSNAFLIRAASQDRVLAFANLSGLVEPDSAVTDVVIHTGNEADTVSVNADVVTPVEVIDNTGKITWVNPGDTKVFPASNATNNPADGASGNGGNPGTTGPGTTDPNGGKKSPGGSTSSTGGTPTGTTGGSPSSGPSTTPTTTSDGTSAQISFTSPQSFYAGLSAHVNALSSTLGAGTVLTATYTWDFGDAGSAYNQLVGFDAAHQYNTPGTYTITLSITDANGQTSTSTQQVTVLSTSALRTIYVSPTGNDANSGATPDQAIQSIGQLNNLLGDNTIVYFQSGGTYTFSSGNGINVNHFQNVEITSYGSGAQPILFYNGGYEFGDFIAIQSASNGILVNGLTFDSIYPKNNDVNPIPTGVSLQGTNINVTNCTFYNVGDDTDMSLSPTNVLIQGNSSPSPTGLNGYFAWVQGSDISIIGNTVANSLGEHIVRVSGSGAVRTLIEDNTFSNVKDAGGDANNIGKGTIVLQVGSYAYVYGNTIPSGPIGVGPLSLGTYVTNNASFSYAVFDSNITSDTILFQPNALHVIAKNNVLYENSTTGGFVVNSTAVVSSTDTWQVQDLTLVNNTVIDSATTGSFLSIFHGESQGIVMDNNLFIDPGFQTGGGQGLIRDFNNDLASFTEIKDNVWALPSPSAWAQGGFFYVNVNPGVQSGYITPQEWEAMPLGNDTYATGDVYTNVDLTQTYQVGTVTAGSTLLNAELAAAA
jgi:hypothetical protein